MKQNGKGKELWNSSSHSECNPAKHLVWVGTWALSDTEKESLLYGYREEMLARDVYTHFYELYDVEVFANIAQSETKHMEAVKVLLDRYGIAVPTDHWTLHETYSSLIVEWEISLQKALEVWLKIEMLDIEDIIKSIKNTDNDDIKIIFSHIGGASYNHLRGFIKTLWENELTSTIDYSGYISADDLESKGKELKTKILDRLKQEWVVMPDMPQNIHSQDGHKEHMQKSSHQWNDDTHKKADKMNKYKKQIGDKYQASLAWLSSEKKNKLGKNIEAMYMKIENNTSYSPELKERYFTLLDALKELISEQK